MTVSLAADGTIELAGLCAIEDAEKLQQYLLANPHAAVDWRACAEAHTAVVQILLAAKPVVRGPPAGGFLRQFMAQLVASESVATPVAGK